jgi:hypothetical protein
VVIGAAAAEARVMPPFLFTVGACAGLWATLSVGIDNGLRPEELVTLTNHGAMKLARSSKSDDVTTPGARFGYDHSRK